MGVERVGFDDVGAGFQVRSVDAENDVGAGEYEMIVTAFERGSAEVLSGERVLLNERAHGSVEDQDSFVERFNKRLLPVIHACLFLV